MRKNKIYPILFVLLWITFGIFLLAKRTSRGVDEVPVISKFHSPLLKDQFGSPTLLSDLGFVFDPRLYPQSYHADTSDLPVFVGAVSSKTFADFLQFVRTLRLFYSDKKLVVYNLDLTRQEATTLRSDCRCVIRDVRWEHFPHHVKNPQYQAYRPILIQKALMEFGAIFWCESSVRFTSAEIFLLLSQGERVGVVAWPIMYPTSALTHYNMFRYFNTSHEKYYFHKMVETDGILLYNTEAVHTRLMLPWIKCALEEECVAPTGSQPHGCNFNLHPKYLYSGCHKYDMSAFNVVLGEMFKMEMPYIALMDIYKVATAA